MDGGIFIYLFFYRMLKEAWRLLRPSRLSSWGFCHRRRSTGVCVAVLSGQEDPLRNGGVVGADLSKSRTTREAT